MARHKNTFFENVVSTRKVKAFEVILFRAVDLAAVIEAKILRCIAYLD
jgi:hypothetical protein